MDGNGSMNLRTWAFLESDTRKGQLDLQLMSSMAEKPLFGRGVRDHHHTHHPSSVMASTNGGQFHHHRVGGISESHLSMDSWMDQNRDKYPNILSGSHHHDYYPLNYVVSPETSSPHSILMPQPINLSSENFIPQVERFCEERDECSGGNSSGLVKKRGGGKVAKSPPKEKKPRTKHPRVPKNESICAVNRARAPRKCAEVVINGITMDISGIPIPVCSCTGTPHQCYRWGSGGWQSACCTTSMSVYPLPMNTKRRGARIAGRKMSIGAFKKVLEKLASEGYDFSNPIDLRKYWAKHGTNKFATIR